MHTNSIFMYFRVIKMSNIRISCLVYIVHRDFCFDSRADLLSCLILVYLKLRKLRVATKAFMLKLVPGSNQCHKMTPGFFVGINDGVIPSVT